MANPKCGTCRFFQENDLPGSGWCHHPQRKVSSDVKILVRRSELACRDDWSRHLWQPATGEPAGVGEPMRPPSSGPLLPASPESLRAVLNRDLAVKAAADEDVLLSEGRIVSESAERWEPPARPFLGVHFDPRTAIFKAREAHREKVRASAKAARRAAEAGTGAFDQAPVEKVNDELGSDAADLDSALTEPLPSDTSELGEVHAEAVSSMELTAVAAMASASGGETGDRELALDMSRGIAAAESDIDTWLSRDPVAQSDVCAPEDAAPGVAPSSVAATQQSLVATQLPAWFRADLPRVCRACRDFRPGADGQRGWCANAWAFTHRQLVREDDAAPCHSAIGDWWVPADDVWLVAADVSTHGRPTPHLDRLIESESGSRRRS